MMERRPALRATRYGVVNHAYRVDVTRMTRLLDGDVVRVANNLTLLGFEHAPDYRSAVRLDPVYWSAVARVA